MVELAAGGALPSREKEVFRLNPWRMSAWLWLASLLVIFLGLFREWYVTAFGFETVAKDLRHLAFNAEYCLPAWYSSLMLVFSAALLAVTALSARRRGERSLFHWALLVPIFVGLSVDEATGVHEVLIEPLRSGLALDGFLHFGWVIPGAVVVAMLGLFYLPFLLALPSRTRLMFFGAGLLYVGGALGMEIVGGKLLTLYGEESFPYQLAYCVEEIMEILGATLFAASLLGHLKRRFGGAVLALS
ncbi:hypothetical protein [Parvibaculum sp.]|uniref:hypothetical protein n=1 Tax=Parvibaculum sp. TaxID=2024848 RepID=UPI003297CB71